MAATSQNKKLFEDYDGFVEKFKPKKTTDDCYTPPIVYNAVAEWVANEYDLDKSTFVRPFKPGGDYEREDYNGKIVVDNPPFSILAAIVDFYLFYGIKFFSFCTDTHQYNKHLRPMHRPPCWCRYNIHKRCCCYDVVCD